MMLDAINTTRITFCSSEADAAALKAAGVRAVRVIERPEQICTPDADGNPTLVSDLAPYGQFVLAFNADDSDLRDAVAIRIGDTRCRWVRWPDGFQGPAHLARECDKQDVADSIERAALPLWKDEICLLDDVPDEGPLQTYRTGFDKLDDSDGRFFRLIRPAFMPVIGPYGSGKSVLLRQLACNLWKIHGWRTLLTSFEERIKPRYVRDLRRHIIGANRARSRGQDDVVFSKDIAFAPEEIRTADEEINAAFRFLRRKRNTVLDVERLIDRIEYAVQVYGVDVVIIDPINEIDHVVPSGMNKTDYMGFFIMRLKQLADDYNLLMIVAAHPPKDGTARRQRVIYTLNDGADTAHYGNKADIGWCVWRPSGTGPTYLNIDKIKDTEEMGTPTLAKLSFQGGGFRFADVGDHIIGQLGEMEDEA